METYSKRIWLNPKDSSSTGSVVAFHGETSYGEKIDVATFFEIADCRSKARLHKIRYDAMSDFISKLRMVENAARDFATFLEKESNPAVERTGN